MADPQNLKNHQRIVPGFHMVLGIMLVANLYYAAHMLMRGVNGMSLHVMIFAVSVLLTAWYARAFALAAQDRVIRLEMRLRVKELAPQLSSRFDELRIGQVVALRFAGDDELAALMQQVLDGKLTKGADIKAAVKNWKADTQRV